MRGTSVSPSEMTMIAYSTCVNGFLHIRHCVALRYASHCSFDKVSMGTLADKIILMQCANSSSSPAPNAIFIATKPR